MMAAWRRFFAMAAALLLSGCMLSGGDTFYGSSGGGGGGEDFPNTVQTLSRVAVEDLSASDGWAQDLELPEVPDVGNLDSLRVEPLLSKRAPLAKGAAIGAASEECIPVLWTWSITELLVHQSIRKIVCDEDSIRVRRDTLFYYWPGGPIPGEREPLEQNPENYLQLISSRGSITWKQGSKIQFFRCANLDSLGGMDYGEYQTLQIDSAARVAIVQRVKIYGPDEAYLKADAPPEEFEYLRIGAAGDTLEWKRMTDADGDRAFWKEDGTGIVDFARKVSNPAGEPGTARLSLSMRAELRHEAATGDSLRRLSYRDARLLYGGATTSFSMLGIRPDSLLRPLDTALVTVDTVFSTRDSMARFSGVYHLLLGAVVEKMDAHALLDYGIEKNWRLGALRRATTSFVPRAPAYPNQGRFEGRMKFLGEYANGDSVQTTGDITATGIDMQYREVKGGKESTYRILFDVDGKVVGEPQPTGADSTAQGAPAARRPARP